MFKIDEPKINDLINIKYNDVETKEKLENYNFVNENIKLEKNVEINNCKFNGIIFDKVYIKYSNIEDVDFINCDLSNVNFIDTSMYRVRFVNCKLLGVNFIDLNINNMIIENSMCNLINISSSKLKNIELNNSNFKDSTIINCELKNISINDINFSNSEIVNTPLNGIDFSNSNLERIKTDLNSIKGMIIDYYQMVDLIGLLGIKIKE